MNCELVFDVRVELGEGPLWDDRRQRLLFVDIMRGHIHEFDPVARADRIINVGRPVGAVALTEKGDWIAAAADGFYRVDPASGKVALLVAIEANLPDNRMNDGYVDARGRFWAGTMGMAGRREKGTLYRLDPDGKVRRMLGPVSISNGLDWSPDNRIFYYTDLALGRVDQFDFEVASGTIKNRRPFVEFPTEIGYPDGLIVDAEGFVWVALWEGGSLHRYAPDGRLDVIVPVPASQTTKCAFGGPDMRDLYVTTAWIGLDAAARAEQPHAGSLFRIRPGVRGKNINRFAG
ncbi:MAG TPA: SMP-30/gluconolactonase/LRE family protein [Vicinamibacterales bacterium]|nr:SMP-30/gluconolactonase/LRE family protein [Vicinamibacterales bacterium]